MRDNLRHSEKNRILNSDQGDLSSNFPIPSPSHGAHMDLRAIGVSQSIMHHRVVWMKVEGRDHISGHDFDGQVK